MGNYLKYAIGEIVLVVIGILIALQINNWNSERIDSNKEIIYIKRLEKDISDQVGELERIVDFYNFQIAICDSILGNYKKVYNFRQTDSIEKKISFLMFSTLIQKVNTTFNELNSTAQLSLIQNAEITNSTIQFYQNIDGLEQVILGNQEKIFYPRVIPVFLDALNLNPEFFVGPEKGHPTNFHTNEMNELVESNLDNPSFQRELLNAVSLVIMINETDKSAAESSILEGKELLDLLKAE